MFFFQLKKDETTKDNSLLIHNFFVIILQTMRLKLVIKSFIEIKLLNQIKYQLAMRDKLIVV